MNTRGLLFVLDKYVEFQLGPSLGVCTHAFFFLIQLFSRCFGQQGSVTDTNLHDQQSVQFINSLLGNVTVNEDVDQDIDFSEAELQPGKTFYLNK